MISLKLMLLAALALLSIAIQALATPNYDRALRTVNNAAETYDGALSKRANAGAVLCYPVPGQDWVPIDAIWIQGQNDKLISGQLFYPSIDAIPPHHCDFFQFDVHKGIFACNDNDYHITPDYTTVAHYVQQILDQCSVPQAGGGSKVAGQVSDAETGRWNVVVAGDFGGPILGVVQGSLMASSRKEL